jgi:mRNA-degrading endonuclease RelE of RelBE toxin-antitoxin system
VSLIRGLHPRLTRKIRSGLDAILADPAAGKALRDELSGLWSFRVGKFRIVYRKAPDRAVEIVAIGPRRTIYEETFLSIRRK